MKFNKFVMLILISSFTLFTPLMSKEVSHKVIPVTTAQPELNRVYPVAIIGSGAAGTMAAKRAVLNNDTVLLFTGAKKENKHSRGYWVRTVDNIPGFEKYERTVLQLRNEALKDLVNSNLSENLFIIENSVVAIEKEGDIFKLVDGQGHAYSVKYVILATGIMDEQPHIQGSIRPILPYANGQSAAYCLLCDGHRSFNKKTAVIGYSESAAKGAILLAERYHTQDITILTNGMEPQFSPETITLLKQKNIKIVSEPITSIKGKDKSLEGFKLSSGKVVNAEIVFVLLGIRPNNELALQLGADIDERGLVLADENGETSVPNLFVAGDLRANSLKQIYTAWKHGVDASQAINRRIR